MSSIRADWPAAVSPLVAETVSGPARRARVLGVFPTCVYLGTEQHAGVVALLARDALQLPIGLCLTAPSGAIDWGIAGGDVVDVGEGRVRLPRADVVAARVQRPARVRVAQVSVAQTRVAQVGVAQVRMDGRTSRGQEAADALDGVDGPLVQRAHELATAALDGQSTAPLLRTIIGAGPGLTPSGDDAVSGVLLTLRGSGELRAVERLDRAIRPLLPATTSLSAALLVAAADGYAAPEVVALVDQLGTGPGPTDGSALDRVLAIGHTSGSDLVSGMAGTIRALRSAIHAQPKETLHA